jgi:hypothetical protein
LSIVPAGSCLFPAVGCNQSPTGGYRPRPDGQKHRPGLHPEGGRRIGLGQTPHRLGFVPAPPDSVIIHDSSETKPTRTTSNRRISRSLEQQKSVPPRAPTPSLSLAPAPVTQEPMASFARDMPCVRCSGRVMLRLFARSFASQSIGGGGAPWLQRNEFVGDEACPPPLADVRLAITVSLQHPNTMPEPRSSVDVLAYVIVVRRPAFAWHTRAVVSFHHLPQNYVANNLTT